MVSAAFNISEPLGQFAAGKEYLLCFEFYAIKYNTNNLSLLLLFELLM